MSYTPQQLDKIKKCVKRCKHDFLFMAEHFLKVEARVGGKVINLQLSVPQQILHDIVENRIKPKRLVRIVALKARRMGFSTYFSARFYQKTSLFRHRYATQITHEPEATDVLFKMVKRMLDNVPPFLRPQQKYNNARLLEFQSKTGDGLGSGFRVATAGKEDYGSGQAIHYLHLSEVSKWAAENATNLLLSVLQTVSDEDEDTEIALESTAKGVGGEFYDRFWNAKYRIWVTKLDAAGKPVIVEEINPNAAEDNNYTSIFLPWFVDPAYKAPVPGYMKSLKEARFTEEEKKWMEEYGISGEQVYWYRLTIANRCGGDIRKAMQEYPFNPMDAFLTTGNPVFDNVKLKQLADACPQPIARYEVDSFGSFNPSETGRFVVWEEPRTDASYIIGADVAEGLAHGDFSIAFVIDHRTGVQVAEWHGKIDADQFAVLLKKIGLRYNTAYLVPERNNHGYTVVTMLQGELRYPQNRIYVEHIPEPPGKPRPRYGWVTNLQTRPMIIDNLVREVREGIHGIRSKATLMEMMMFKVQDNGRMEADKGQHDDRVLAAAITKYARQAIRIPAMRIPKSEERKPTRLNTRRRPDTRGWT